MIRAAIEKILEMAAPTEIMINGIDYTNRNIRPVSPPRTERLDFKSLKGLCDAIKAEHSESIGELIVRVTRATQVDVFSFPYGNDHQRDYLYSCKAQLPVHDFGHFITLENMIIALRSKYVRTASLDEHIQLVGSIFEESSVVTSDDGISQNVAVRKGIALKANKTINPIVRLTPFRTFSDVEQPASDFLFRIKEGGTAALFEADGGAWENEARRNIAMFLRTELEELKDIITIAE
jgi:hypothetical protein